MTMMVLFPGTVAVFIPYRMLTPIDIPGPGTWALSHFGALLVASLGLAILLTCIWEFAHSGRGTLAPFDEPKRLVVRGLYRYVRNPMYIGVALILLGESWFFGSGQLLAYAGLFFLLANVVVIGYEEQRLRSKFGQDYERYCQNVRRWLPGKPYVQGK